MNYYCNNCHPQVTCLRCLRNANYTMLSYFTNKTDFTTNQVNQ